MTDPMGFNSAMSGSLLGNTMVVSSAKDYTASGLVQLFLSGTEGLASRELSGPADPLRQVTWVYACVSALATSAARVPVRLSRGEAAGTRPAMGLGRARWGAKYARKYRRGDWHARGEKDALYKAREGEIVEDGDLWRLLRRPNPEQRWAEFVETTVGLLYTQGRVHWLFDDMIGRKVLSMVPIGGKTTKPIFDKTGRVKKLLGWEFAGEYGKKFPVAVEECITFQLFDPADPHAGLSPLVPSRLAVMGHYNADLYNAAMFANSCEPGGFLTSEAGYDKETDRELRSAFEQRHRGAGNARRLAILYGGLRWQDAAKTMADMQGEQLQRMKREDICACFRVPPSIAGFLGTTGDASAYVSAEQKRFWQDTAGPLCDKIADAANSDLAPRYEGGLEAWADLEDVPIFQEIRRSQVDTVVKYHGMGVPMADLNEAYDLGLPDRPWYQTGFLPIGVIPAAQAAENPLPQIPDAPTAPGNDELDLPAEDVERGALGVGRSGEENGEEKDELLKASMKRVWQNWMRSWSPLARRCESMLKTHYAMLGSVAERLLRRLLQSEIRIPKSEIKDETIIARLLFDLFDNESERAKFTARLQKIGSQAAALGVRQTLTEAGLCGAALKEAEKRLMASPRVAAAIRSDAVRIGGKISDAARKQLRASLTEGMNAGESVNQLADRVQNFVQGSRKGALTVARNVVGQTLSMARHEGMREAGITHELWIHSRAGDPQQWRKGHVAAEAYYRANPKPINVPFLIDDCHLRFPRDPQAPPKETVNCQCLVIGKRIVSPMAASAAGMVQESIVRGFVPWAEMQTAEDAEQTEEKT